MAKWPILATVLILAACTQAPEVPNTTEEANAAVANEAAANDSLPNIKSITEKPVPEPHQTIAVRPRGDATGAKIPRTAPVPQVPRYDVPEPRQLPTEQPAGWRQPERKPQRQPERRLGEPETH